MAPFTLRWGILATGWIAESENAPSAPILTERGADRDV
jgi:hypothetical protein